MMKSIMTLNILLITMAVLGCCLPALGADDNTPVCPVTGATGAASTLPAMPPNHSATPGTMPATGAGAVGTISIQAVQRTKGGPAIGEDNVTILLIQPNDENGRPPEPKTIKIKLDKQGKADLKNLSLQTMFKPQVFVDHAGVLFDAAGEAISGTPVAAARPARRQGAAKPGEQALQGKQKAERGQHDARKLPGGRWPCTGLEPVGGGVAALAGQVLDGQGHQHPGQQQRQNGPPQRFGVEAHALGQVGEDPPLQLADQGQKEVGGRRDGRPNDRGDDQQNDIAPGPQQRERIGQRTHRASLLNPRVAVRGVAERTAT